MPEWPYIVAMLATGLVGGTLGGLLGIGGSIVFIPLMKELLGADPHTAIAAALVVNVCVGTSSAVGHARSGRIMGSILAVLIPCSVAASLVGVHVGNRFTGEAQVWLWRLLGVAMVYVAALNTYRLFRPLSPDDSAPGDVVGPPPKRITIGVVGVATGLSSGLLGIGGGSVAVPAQQVFLRMRLRTAIANSSILVIFSCLLAAVYKHLSLESLGIQPLRPWMYVVLLAPTAIVGAYIGSHLTHRVGRTWVRLAFIVFLVFAAFKMLTGRTL